MWVIIDVILLIMVGFVAWPLVLLSMEIIGAFFSKSEKPTPGATQPNLAILIPAHNEELDIAETVNSLVTQLGEGHRVLVVADNCSDKTAQIAMKAGAEVIVRNNPDNRGKGFALDFGIKHLKSNPPEVLIIVDADCVFSQGSINSLAQMVLDTGKPVQSQYLIHPQTDCDVGQQISAFAMILKNHIRLLGLKKLGAPCHLTGSGMAFPWQIIEQANLASGNIVEDMKLGVDLVSLGHGPLYCPQAHMNSKFPESDSAQQEQKTRWVHGHLQTILSFAPKLIWDCLRQRRWRDLIFALDLAIPPLSLVFFFVIIALALTGITSIFGVGLLAFGLLLSICVLFVVSLFWAWWGFGRNAVPVRSLISVPGYVFSKLTLYRRFVRHRQEDWVRTKRH